MKKTVVLCIFSAAFGLMSCSQQADKTSASTQGGGDRTKTDSQVSDEAQQEIKKLIEMLGSEDDNLRREAESRLVSIGERALPLLESAMDVDASTSKKARLAIVELEMKIAEAARLKSESARVRQGDGRPLEVREAEWESLIPQTLREGTRKRILRGLLSDKQSDLIEAIDDVYQYARDNQDMLPILRKLLHHNESWVRERATCYLGILKDYDSLPDILKLLKDPDARVRAEAIRTIGRIGNKDTIDQLAELLKDQDDWVRYNAVESISTLGDKKIVPILEPFLNDPYKSVKNQVGLALAKFGEKAALPQIMKTISTSGDQYWIVTFLDVLNNYTFPETYERLCITKIGNEIKGEDFVDCYKKFLNQQIPGIIVRFDADIQPQNWVSTAPTSVSTKRL
jgi:HEAT repeat protein